MFVSFFVICSACCSSVQCNNLKPLVMQTSINSTCRCSYRRDASVKTQSHRNAFAQWSADYAPTARKSKHGTANWLITLHRAVSVMLLTFAKRRYFFHTTVCLLAASHLRRMIYHTVRLTSECSPTEHGRHSDHQARNSSFSVLLLHGFASSEARTLMDSTLEDAPSAARSLQPALSVKDLYFYLFAVSQRLEAFGRSSKALLWDVS